MEREAAPLPVFAETGLIAGLSGQFMNCPDRASGERGDSL
jgi:hypothetical protein